MKRAVNLRSKNQLWKVTISLPYEDIKCQASEEPKLWYFKTNQWRKLPGGGNSLLLIDYKLVRFDTPRIH